MQIRSRYSKIDRVPFICRTPSVTQQHFKDECDIDRILKKYQATGFLVDPLKPRRQPLFGDFSNISSFQEMQNAVAQAYEVFDALPSQIRDRFGNSPQKLMDWLSDPDNAQEAFELGLAPEPKKAEPEPVKPVEVAKPAESVVE